jgi:hypothetical protein
MFAEAERNAPVLRSPVPLDLEPDQAWLVVALEQPAVPAPKSVSERLAERKQPADHQLADHYLAGRRPPLELNQPVKLERLASR